MNYIFTDVDGVLNSGADTKVYCGDVFGIEIEKVKLLKELAEKTDSGVVLSSTWRLGAVTGDIYWNHLLDRFSEAGLEISGCTPIRHWSERAYEILSWLDGKDAAHIVILDDENFHWKEYGLSGYWINTRVMSGGFHNRSDGLTQEHVDHIIENYDRFTFKMPVCK